MMDMETGYCLMCEKHCIEIESLRAELEAVKRERDEYCNELKHGALPSILLLQEQLTTCQKERDELEAALKYLQEYRLWPTRYAKTVIESALAKVGADKGEKL